MNKDISGVERFLNPNKRDYPAALAEIRAGRKRSHWIWYIFPQIKGLGSSSTAQYYSIKDIEEAREFLAHPVLGAHLIEISQALLELQTSDADLVMGWPDNLKLCSSMTLFEAADPTQEVFGKVLDKFYAGQRDKLTLQILGL